MRFCPRPSPGIAERSLSDYQSAMQVKCFNTWLWHFAGIEKWDQRLGAAGAWLTWSLYAAGGSTATLPRPAFFTAYIA